MNRLSLLACSCALVVGAAAGAPKALATTVNRHELQNATGLCQAALPNFDGQIRKRPTAISNEGTGIAFVSCSLVGDNSRSTTDLDVRLKNNGTTAQVANCVLVSGTVQSRIFITKSLPLAAGTSALLTWTAVADNGGVKFDYPNVQCSFMPGVELDYVERNFKETVGR